MTTAKGQIEAAPLGIRGVQSSSRSAPIVSGCIPSANIASAVSVSEV